MTASNKKAEKQSDDINNGCDAIQFYEKLQEAISKQPILKLALDTNIQNIEPSRPELRGL